MSQNLGTVNKRLNDFIWNLNGRIQHQRSLHTNTLVNAFQEGILTEQPQAITDMMAKMIMDRDEYNGRKTEVDADEWLIHDNKISRALGKHTNVLNGGSVLSTRRPQRLRKAM